MNHLHNYLSVVPRRAQRSRALTIGVAGCLAALLAASIPGAGAATAKKTTAKTTTKANSKSTTKAKSTTKSTVKASKKPGKGLYQPNGRPPNPAAPFLWTTQSQDPQLPSVTSFEKATDLAAPGNKLFTMLIIGSDARPGEPYDRTRGDSVHLFVWWPVTNKGTIIGFPRDLWVDIPGKGKGKLNSSLTLGGPALLMATVNAITSPWPALQVNKYVVTGFEGFTNMVNDIGGVNVQVKPSMNDPLSGAQFAEGWFAMNGDAALAFNRNRHSVANGDFSRSANQGKFLLYSLAKMREETSDVTGIVQWITSLRKNTKTNIKLGDMLILGQMARQIDPVNIFNVVVAGKPGKIKGQDVVLVNSPSMVGLLGDVSHDAIPDGK